MPSQIRDPLRLLDCAAHDEVRYRTTDSDANWFDHQAALGWRGANRLNAAVAIALQDRCGRLRFHFQLEARGRAALQ